MTAHTYYHLDPLGAWREGAAAPVSRFTDAATAKPGSDVVGGEEWCQAFVRARIRGEHNRVALLRYRWDNWGAPQRLPDDWTPAWLQTVSLEEWHEHFASLPPGEQELYLRYGTDGTARARSIAAVIRFHVDRGRFPIWYYAMPGFLADVRIPEYQDHIISHAQRSLLRSGADALMITIKTNDEVLFRSATGARNRVHYAEGEFAAANATIVSRLLAAGVRIATLEQASPGRDWEWVREPERERLLGQYLAPEWTPPEGATVIA